MCSAMQKRTRGVQARMEKFTRIDPGGCWEWIGGKVQGGYGVLPMNTAADRAAHSSRLAHRISYEIHVGPIPDGLTIDHLCGNPSCVNPAHLEPVTMRENIRRATFANKTHCANGHEYTPENTYVMPSGYRDCRRCIYLRSRARHNREKATTVRCARCDRPTRHESGLCHTHRVTP